MASPGSADVRANGGPQLEPLAGRFEPLELPSQPRQALHGQLDRLRAGLSWRWVYPAGVEPVERRGLLLILGEAVSRRSHRGVR